MILQGLNVHNLKHVIGPKEYKDNELKIFIMKFTDTRENRTNNFG